MGSKPWLRCWERSAPVQAMPGRSQGSSVMQAMDERGTKVQVCLADGMRGTGSMSPYALCELVMTVERRLVMGRETWRTTGYCTRCYALCHGGAELCS